MREIKFRGKTSEGVSDLFSRHKYIGKGTMIFGCLVNYGSVCSIMAEMRISADGLIRKAWKEIAVDPETVEQYTGIKDKNGVEIYEGDIVDVLAYRDGGATEHLVGEIKQMNGGAYYINHKDAYMKYVHQIHCEVCETSHYKFLLEDYYDGCFLEVIGNIHENPELLEVSNGEK